MIPYDDLVVALQTWRARQGLPVAQLAAVAPAAPAPPPRTNPPAPPRAAVAPPPLAPPDTHDEPVDDASLIEEAHYENEGDDFAMAFGQPQPEAVDESTAVGHVPAVGGRDSFGGSTEPEPPPVGKHNNNDDW